MRGIIYFILFVGISFSVVAQEKIDEQAVALIKKHGLEESKVMHIASQICDVQGARLTGSVALDKAQDWAVKELKSWGLMNVNKEPWGEFGRGWELEHFEMHAHTPHYWQVIAYPKAWSPSTPGKVTGEVVYLKATTVEELEKYKGKLADKFVMLDTIRDLKEWFDPLARRYESDDLLDMANAPVPVPRPRRNWQGMGGFSFNRAMWQFLYEEKPACVIDRGFKGDLGTVFVAGAITSNDERTRPQSEEALILPQVTMSIEHYNRIMRMMNHGKTVTLSLEIKSNYQSPHEGIEHNVIAEIPGSDLADEIVMFGAHYDSWHAGTGATDNGAGSAVMMEAARILNEMIKESGIQPRRTLRLALWSGEEQGLFGSINYVRNHFAETEPGGWVPKSLKPDHEKVSAYYNLDNGTGKIRGVYMQGNAEVMPIFRAWLQPFKDMDASTLTLNNTGGTDHLAFDGVGIPGFQFIQEPMAYFNRTHHSNMDNFDHLVEDDLKQAATIIASFIWHTSQRDEKIPRKPLVMDTGESTGAGSR